MEQSKLSYLQDILPQLQIDVTSAFYTQCWDNWSDYDYIPDYNQIYFICGGEGLIQIGGQDYYPREGQLCLLPTKVKQSYSVFNDNPYLKYWCHFKAKIGHLDLFQLIDVPIIFNFADQKQIIGLFEELVALHVTPTLSARLREKAVMLELIAVCLEHSSSTMLANKSFNLERPLKIRQYIEDHLHEALSVDTLAQTFYLHPNYFIKYFKKHFGIPPLRYINRKRIETAKFLLKSTNLSVKEIAERVGYEDLGYFSKTFKKETSFTPSEFRGSLLALN